MLIILSPSKKLDFKTAPTTAKFTQSELLDKAEYLVKKLQDFSAEDLAKMMKVNFNISQLNYERFHSFKTPFTPDNSKQAILTYDGEAFLGLDANNFDDADLDFAQQHLRILSGLYGALRPFDLIQAYRLDMLTKFAVSTKKKNLYQYWDGIITQVIKEAIAMQGDNVLLNLASNEYFKTLDEKALNCKIVSVVFKDLKNDTYKPITVYVKRARGMMTNYVIKNKITSLEHLIGFDYNGYYFSPNESTETELVFLRDKPQ